MVKLYSRSSPCHDGEGVVAMNLLNDFISLVNALIVVWFGWWLNNRNH